MAYSTNGGPARRSTRLRNHFEFLSDDLVHIILSRLPLAKVFQVQSVCHLWRSIISSSRHFHKLWEERNSEQWLVMDNKDGGVALFNRSAWLKKMIFDSSCWHLMAASGGLLLYRNKKDGTRHVVNPLTMQSRQLPDPRLGYNHLSSYLESDKYTDGIFINLTVNSTARTYQVIFKPNLTELTEILIYRSADLSWEIKDVVGRFRRPVYGKWFPYKTASNQTILCFPLDQIFGQELFEISPYNPVASYNLNGKSSAKVVLAKDLCNGGVDLFNCVFFKGGTIREALWTPPTGRIVQIIYELDVASCEWNIISVCRWNCVSIWESAGIDFEELLCEKDFVVRCGGGDGDYVWIMPSDSDKDAFKTRHDNFNFNGHNHENSTVFPMQLRFWPCP